VGLYLHVERGFTGKEVQFAHMKLGRTKQAWPVFALPEFRGTVTATTVLAARLDDRDRSIHAWCKSIWREFAHARPAIEQLLAANGITDSWSVKTRR
jgi:hypothetical protein